jgi:hypothetical protein
VLFEGDCEDFEYLEDYELFYDDYRFLFEDFEYEYGYNPFEDCEFESIPYIRLETLEELGERLGTVVTPEYTDENGDATFELPAGCYYAVISGAGYETVVELFCLEPGETEVNEVNLGEAPGRLIKKFVPPFFLYCNVLDEDGIGTIGENYDREECIEYYEDGFIVEFFTEIEYTDVALEVNICAGADVLEEDCDDPGDDTVFHGGADDFNLIDLDIEIDLAPGEYTLCYEGYFTFEAYDPIADEFYDEYIDVGPLCETFTIVSEEITYLLNFTDDALYGILDVFVYDAGGVNILGDILVQLFEVGDVDGDGVSGEMVDEGCTDGFDGDGIGEVDFFVPEGSYMATATDSSDGSYFGCGDNDFYETQDGSETYTVFEDWNQDGYIDDDIDFFEFDGSSTADILLLLDPVVVAPIP